MNLRKRQLGSQFSGRLRRELSSRFTHQIHPSFYAGLTLPFFRVDDQFYWQIIREINHERLLELT